MTREEVRELLKVILDWVQARSDVIALAVVGSWARGAARPESDLDLMFLVDTPETYRGGASWVSEIPWQNAGFRLMNHVDVDYGNVWSRHILLDPQAELELAFGDKGWASVDPIDSGAAGVARDGCQILLDRDGVLRRLLERIDDGL